MLVVIPTFRRNECLGWVLQSLVQCRTGVIEEVIRVLVVNNYPPAAKEVSNIVARFASHDQFSWEVLYRERTLEPVENWYSAISDNAGDDEVVFLHSDDDIFLPWSLQTRYTEIVRHQADMLLAQLGPTAFFSDGATRISCDIPPTAAIGAEIRSLRIADVPNYAPQHISNHCYRNTSRFRMALSNAFSWCNALEWLDSNTRTLLLPLYLPLALLLTGGHVLGLTSPCTIRGQDLEEVARVQFGAPSWNPGFIHLAAWHILQNTDLGPLRDLDSLRDQYARMFTRWLFTYFFDRRVGGRKLLRSMSATGFPWSRLLSVDAAHGLRLLAGELLGIRGRVHNKTLNCSTMTCEDFLCSLQGR